MSAYRIALGERGERIAAKWLRLKGFEIIDRRFRSGHRDIDLVASITDAGGCQVVAFVEVKTRSSSLFGGPLAAVNWRKQRELRRSAWVWMARHPNVGEYFRFDVIGVLVTAEHVRVQHVENAFVVPVRS